MKERLKQFNETLKRISEFVEELQRLIEEQEWSDETIAQADAIVRQLKNRDVIEKEGCISCSHITLIRPKITLSPRQCGIDSETFGPEEKNKAEEYIKKLLDDINCISKDIYFYLGGIDLKDDVCTFYISWEF